MALHDISLPDEIEMTDSIEAELITLSPQLDDEITVTDAISTETAYHRLASDSITMVDSIETELSQVPGETHRQLADAMEVTDVIEVLVFRGVPQLAISSVTPQRGRAGETITIAGVGFAASNNSVRLDGTLCTIVTQGITEIVVTQPTTFNVLAGFAVLQVSNFDNNQVQEVPYWITNTLIALKGARIYDQLPGPKENTSPGSDSDTAAEARDWMRLATILDLLNLSDLLTSDGDAFVRDATGIARLIGDTTVPGASRIAADSSNSQGIRWGYEMDIDFPFGFRLAAGSSALNNMVANGGNTTTTSGQADEWTAPLAGVIDAVYVYQRSALVGDDLLDQVRILVNGASEHDSGTGLAIGHRSAYFAGNFSIAVAAGDRIQLQAKKNGTLDDMDLTGAVRMQTA